jgi:hypothetical protein
MAVDDRGIVAGITTYPSIGSLEGAELDAEEFYDWLTSPTGGDVPSTAVEKIVSSDFQPAPPVPPVRLPAQEIAQAFDRLHAAALATGIPRRLGRRLYVYTAGHGAALPFAADPERSDAAFLTADATQFNATHIMTKVRALYFLNAGIFDEIVVFMDCCRIPLSLIPNYPSYINATAIDTLENERRTFFAFATKWGLKAREKPFNGVMRGVFTTALMAGLRGEAANPDGTITSSSLRNYLLSHMKDRLTTNELNDPDIPKRPDVPAPAVELVFTTVPPPRVIVSVSFPPGAAGQLIRVRGDGFKIIASGQTAAGVPWGVPQELAKGGYLVELPVLGLEQDFTLLGTERNFHVTIN